MSPMQRDGRSTRLGHDAPDRWLGIGEAAEAFGLAHVEIREAIREGRLPTQVGRRGSQIIQNTTRLHPGVALVRVYFQHAV